MAENKWRPSRKKNKLGVAIFNYKGDVKGGLKLQIGEVVQIIEEYGTGPTGWYRGFAIRNKAKKGIFPVSYIHIKDSTVDNEGQYETVTPLEDSTVKEVAYVLREWSVIWKKLFIQRHSIFRTTHVLMTTLINLRQQLASAKLTEDQKKVLKQQIVCKIDSGNRILGMDLVPRVNGEVINPEQCSLVELYRNHVKSVENARNSGQSTHRDSMRNSNDSTDLKDVKLKGTFHLQVSFKSHGCNIGEDSETYIGIYDAREGKFIRECKFHCPTPFRPDNFGPGPCCHQPVFSYQIAEIGGQYYIEQSFLTSVSNIEKFLVKCTKQGMPTNLERLFSYYALFTDLTEKDLTKDLYLVAQIYRLGRLLPDSTKRTVTIYRRPYGVAVWGLKEFIEVPAYLKEEMEIVMKVNNCESEVSFPSYHENLIKKQGASDKSANGIVIALQLHQGDLPTVKSENPMLFSKGISIVQKLGFPEVIIPGEIRNDLFLTLTAGEFDRGNKKSQKNVEVKVTVFDESGRPIPDCLIPGCGENPVSCYNSSVYYHCNSPKWNETIKLSLPIEKYPGAHVRFELYHCSNTKDKKERKLFGFAFIRVTERDLSIGDGSHDLAVYKCDDQTKIKHEKYTTLPTFSDDFNDTSLIGHIPKTLPYERTSKESLSVSTLLISTKFSQSAEVLGILKWREIVSDINKIEKNLNTLLSLKGEELMKCLQDILEALFSMLISDNNKQVPHAQTVFQVLIHIFCLIEDTKFKQFAPVIKSYMSDSFACSLVYRDLLTCMRERVNLFIAGDKKYSILLVFRVIGTIFKFILKAVHLHQRSANLNDAEIKLSIRQLFDSFGRLFSSTTNENKPAQIRLLTNLNSTFDTLWQLMSKKEVSELLLSLVNKMPKQMSDALIAGKMELLRKCIKSELFTDKDSRNMLLPLCMQQIQICLIEKFVPKTTVDTLGDILNALFELKKVSDVKSEIQTVIMSLFDVVMSTTLILDDHYMVEIGGILIACFTEMLRLMNEFHYSSLLQCYPQNVSLKDFLIRVMVIFLLVIKPEIFPPDWTVMRMETNDVILTALQYFTGSLVEKFLSGEHFDLQLWSNYFHLAVGFVTQPSLQLEQFSDAKRDRVRERYQDMRVLMGFQLQTLWQRLNYEQKFQFIPMMIVTFLDVTLVPETELRKATLPIIFDMMVSERKVKKSFSIVKAEIVRQLDLLVTNNSGDQEYKELFKKILLDKVQSEPTLKDEGTQFIMSVSKLLEQLLDHRQVLEGEDNTEKRMQCTFNLLNFYRNNFNQEEMYIRYINKLFELHLSSNNYVEAGLTLQQYAKRLEWNDEMLCKELRYPAQRQCMRKESLYKEIIDCFDKGKAWEYGIPLCKELSNWYERLYNYKKLSDILEKEAYFFNQILQGSNVRQNPSYYRVAYYGKTFPPFVRNKVFVYRGDECLKLATIMQNILTEFPAANMLNSNSPPDEKIKNSDSQYIQICSVKPIAKERPEFCGHEVPAEVKSFYDVNEVQTFQYDRPYHRGKRDSNNEFKSLCLERTILKTYYQLPGILRWYEVTETHTEILLPPQAAVESIRTMNNELTNVIEQARINPSAGFKTFEMRLQGVISGAVNGGIPKYQEAFLTNEFALEHPDEAIYLEELKAVIDNQLQILANGLRLHGKLASEALQPLHRNLVEIFGDIRRLLNRSDSKSQSLLDLSVDDTGRPGSPTSLHSNASNRSSTISADAISQDFDSEVQAPIMPEKKRISCQSVPSLKLMPPPLPSRPQSAVYNTASNYMNQTTDNLPSRTGSDPSISFLSSTMTSSRSATSLTSPTAVKNDSGMRRQMSVNFPLSSSPQDSVLPDGSPKSPRVPPPIPRRNSRPGLDSVPGNVSDVLKPALPDKKVSRAAAALNASVQGEGLKPVQEEPKTDQVTKAQTNGPPLPPRISIKARPGMSPHSPPSVTVKSPTSIPPIPETPTSAGPPPIPTRRLTIATKSKADEDDSSTL